MAKTFKRFTVVVLSVCVAAILGIFAAACGSDTDDNNDPVTYTVSFNMQGHGAAPSAQSVEAGKYATKPATDPTEIGYDFGGWYKEAGCENVFIFSNEAINADTTVYAKWTEADDVIPEAPTSTSGFYHVYNSGYTGEVNGTAYSPENVWHYENAFRPDDPAIDYTYSKIEIAANSAITIMWHLDGCTANTQYKFDIREGDNFAQNSDIRANFECWTAVGNSDLEYNIWNRQFGLIGLQIEFTEEQLNPTSGAAMCKVVLQNPTDTAYSLRIICAVGDAH